ncbi:6-pyruvoyl trahydropterin synthase family protein [Pseudomonas brassicacearum]|uniref:6-carboxy-5,6,7,8-tetrahydropterin synthase n=1 Tax=Pseudomonas brassicacearum TaxID=930166 RepID=A0AAJ3KVY1_9PSED|nr:6-carboxytetrahydropterin synthase [Pseudomonas brassicacearum]NUT81020.1 6-carboxytetrahydropterin synthase [Pseudomonas brassicacearum]QGA49544.1 6-carboxytetrahydropterin synthase [Pseudomonas brassicacearum]
MLIRKLFKFESAHIVRNCSSRRCSRSLHGHSYKIEVLLEADALDHGQMVYDFGLLKGTVGDFIDAFDHAVTFWDGDDPDYVAQCKRFSERWVSLPVSPSAEQFSRVFFCLIDAVLSNTQMANGEVGVRLHSVIAHETDTGYAQCFREDAHNPRMGAFQLSQIGFSAQVKGEWANPQMFAKLLAGEVFINRPPA